MVLLEELAYDFCRRQWEQHIIYTEVRYCPHLLIHEAKVKAGSFDMESEDEKSSADDNDNDNDNDNSQRRQSAREVVHAVTRGLRRGCADFDIIVNQIICAINWRPDWAWDVLALALELRNEQTCGVVGIDIAAGEEHFDRHNFPRLHQPHFDMMQRAQALGLEKHQTE
jgi:adenosine deaminase